MKLFRYFFFRDYLHSLEQRSAVPWLRPLPLTAMLLGFNVFTLVEIVGFGPKGFRKRELQMFILFGMVVIALLLYWLWIRNGRYRQFGEEFRDETPRQRKLRTALLIAYSALSFVGYVSAPSIFRS